MKKFVQGFVITSFLIHLTACDKDVFNLPDSGLTEAEIAEGLKAALETGTDTASAQLSAKNGYFTDFAVKILLPTEMRQQIELFKSKSISLGFGISVTGEDLYNGYTNSTLGINIPGLKSKEDALVLGINRAAEQAASTAGPIFKDAITEITISDANNILFGGVDTAATAYLRTKTSSLLYNEYEPEIDAALKSVKIRDASVTDSYENFVADYNAVLNTDVGIGTIGSLMDLNAVSNTDLSAYATSKGLNGLFLKVGEEEKQIRQDPLARVTSILEKVFGALDN